MNYKQSMEEDQIQDLSLINLSAYNNLLKELDHLETHQLTQKEIKLNLKLPEIIIETIKLVALFQRIPINEYLQNSVLHSLTLDINRLLAHHISYENLFRLIQEFRTESLTKMGSE